MGLSVLSVMAYRKVSRDLCREKLMRENTVIEIPDLKIKAPVLEGTDNDILSIAVGHFIGTGDIGTGNYCIAGHSSTIYKEYFNNLKNVELGMKINLYNINKTCYAYTVTESFIVEPEKCGYLKILAITVLQLSLVPTTVHNVRLLWESWIDYKERK